LKPTWATPGGLATGGGAGCPPVICATTFLKYLRSQTGRPHWSVWVAGRPQIAPGSPMVAVHVLPANSGGEGVGGPSGGTQCGQCRRGAWLIVLIRRGLAMVATFTTRSRSLQVLKIRVSAVQIRPSAPTNAIQNGPGGAILTGPCRESATVLQPAHCPAASAERPASPHSHLSIFSLDARREFGDAGRE